MHLPLYLVYDLQTWSMQFLVGWELPMKVETKEALSAVFFINNSWLFCVPHVIYRDDLQMGVVKYFSVE